MDKKEKIILTAEEALKTTVENRMGFEPCMDMIVAQALIGFSFAHFFNEIDEKAKQKLMDMGYQFGTGKDMMGQRFTKITWNN